MGTNGGNFRYLNGKTGNGFVNLVTDDKLSGTRWIMIPRGSGFQFFCNGDGSENLTWLDGITEHCKVGLANSRELSGTFWHVVSQ
ncbi:hypothetical protein WA1_24465 [Scytonema hofmannii PCC 7110]|uniref:Uncharacterized protein n=1 Tax=Scytonema hofmannii PCC 7110 TaxID=128403 RepID=A0A139X7W1_9CYAN|nr:hypothetical protein WA1_24465 [Scytonema hofmannii PCC 7110]